MQLDPLAASGATLKFSATKLAGVWVVELEKSIDERGYFARTFCEKEFAERGLVNRFEQCSTSYNHAKATLRGMHLQTVPHEEVKLVRCTRGAIFDVVIDMRDGSPTLHEWFGLELSAQNGKSLYIPKGFAHGFITLEGATEVYYQISGQFEPKFARAVRWDDPVFGITWPMAPIVISERDKSLDFLER